MGIERIAVIGNGLMGKGIAHVFAQYGYKVAVFGKRDTAREDILKYLYNYSNKNKIDKEQTEYIISNIRIYNLNLDIKRLSEYDLIIETVKEDFSIKEEIISLISKYSNENAVIATNTSGYSITGLSKISSKPEKFLGMHFFSPVPFMKLVEVVKGLHTSETVVNEIMKLVKGIDKVPITVKDSPGFVLSRGLDLMINEAIYMYSEGIVNSVEDLDNIFIHGMGMKVGPLKLADLVGIDVLYAAVSNLHDSLKNDKYRPCPLLKDMVECGKLGKKTGEGFYKY